MNKKFTKLMAALALLTFLAIPMGMWGQETSTLTFTAACGGSGTADDGAVWIVTSDGTESNYDSNKGIHYGTGSAQVKYIQLSTSDISGSITKVVVNASTASGVSATVDVTVGGSAFGGDPKSLTASAANYTFEGSASGEIVVLITKPSKATKALYCKSIAVTYTTGGGDTPTTYTVTYDCNGGTNCPENVTGIDPEDNEIELADAPSKAGYAFAGWNDGTDTYDAGGIYIVEDDVTMKAQWTVNTYGYTMNITGETSHAEAALYVGGNELQENDEIAYGAEVTVSVVTDDGYDYSVSVVDADDNTVTYNEEMDSFIMPASDVTITVNIMEIPTYTVNFYAGSGTFVGNTDFSNTSNTTAAGTYTLPTATPSADCAAIGWEFAGWATASVSETTDAQTLLNDNYPVTADADLYAVYAREEAGGSAPTAFSVGNTGSYAIVSGPINSKYYALPTNPTVNNGKITAEEITVTESDGVKYIKTADATNFTWTIASATNGYTLYDGSNYIYHSNGGNSGTNLAIGTTSTYTWSFTIDGNYVKMAAMNGSTVKDRGMLFSGTTIGGYSLSNWNSYNKTMILPVGDASTVYYATSPDCQERVATPYFTPAAGTYTGAQTVTINCDTDDADILYKTAEDGEWLAYNAAIPVNTTTTIWAKATKDGIEDSEVATAEYVIQYVLTVANVDHVEYFLFDYSDETWDNEITVSEGQALVPAGAEVRISAEAETCYTLQGFNVTAGGSPVEVEDHMSEDGTYSFTMPASDATMTAEVAATTYTIQYSVNGAVVAVLTESVNCGDNATLPTTGITVPEGYTLAGWSTRESSVTVVSPYTPEADATLYAVFASNVVTTKTYSFTISISDFNKTSYAANDGDHTSTATATTGETMTVTWTTSNVMLSNDSEKIQWRKSPAGSLSATNLGTIISVDIDETSSNALTLSSSGGSFSITDNGSNTGYALSVEVVFEKSTTPYYTLIKDVTGTETMTDVEAYHLITVKNGGMLILKGTNNGNESNLIVEDGGQMKLSNDNVYATIKKHIAGYGEGNENTRSGYRLITQPLNYTLYSTGDSGTPLIENTGMLTGNYDFYGWEYDQEGEEWRNYKAGGFNMNNNLYGYLYANEDDVELNFAGPLRNNTSSVDRWLTVNAEDNYAFNGWYLIGNSFVCNAYLVDAETNGTALPYYRMNADGNGFTAVSDGAVIAPMEGIFYEVTQNQRVYMVTTAPAPAPEQPAQSSLNLNLYKVANTRGAVAATDNAIIRFDGGQQLGKFQFNASSKIYFTQGTKEYAIVNSNAEGEMPLNFKATENGTYTISVEAENVEASYLHLIDNMTGMDVDLLSTPSYTFEASTTDYASRFRLMFNATGIEENASGSETFAYYNNGNIVVNNEGQATLYVMDITGRIIATQDCNEGLNTVSTNDMVPGVYMLRLVNGENVKVQKVVVR